MNDSKIRKTPYDILDNNVGIIEKGSKYKLLKKHKNGDNTISFRIKVKQNEIYHYLNFHYDNIQEIIQDGWEDIF